jgi:hypothetical protein
MNSFYQTFYHLINAIEESLSKERIVPALILIYSGIDSISFLAERGNLKHREVFKNWVKKWMLEKYPIPCNEIDIYSARCGLLHQQSSESSLTKNNKAREIYYSWGNANIEILQNSIISSSKDTSVVAVKVEDLFWSFRKGTADCLAAINENDNWRGIFQEKCVKMFISVKYDVNNN